jgi:hemolysin activation/secretion protein
MSRLRAPGAGAWLYCAAQEEGEQVASRHTGVAVALALLLLAPAAQAQDVECTAESGCGAGGPCPLLNLPYEEFIAAPPPTRGGRDIPPVVDRPFDPEAGDRMLVRGFVVEGVIPNELAGINQLSVQTAADAAFAQFSGGAPEARMTVGHMVKVADAVTAFYRTNGYLVAKAVLPVQTIGPDSLVRIQIIEGRISEVAVEGAKRYKPSVLRRPSEGLVGTSPQRDPVETAVLYTQDYPGVRLFGTFRPGQAAGETRLVLQVLEEERFGFQFGLDNYGTELTGLYRARIDAAWNNTLGFGDQLSASVLQSASPENTTFGSLGYALPLGPRGFRLLLEGSQNAFVVDQAPFDQLQLEGTITSYKLGAEWRYQRGRFGNGKVALSYTSKASELTALDTLTVTDDEFSVIEFESTVDRIDVRFKGVDQVTAKLRQGVGGNFRTGGQYEENFSIYEARITRAQVLAETQTVVVRLRGQSTDKSISPLEQFSLAGPDAVRAYPVGQLLRHVGQFASVEYQVQAPGFSRAPGPFNRQWGDLLQVSLFGDYAHGRGAKDRQDRQENAELSGYGAGIRFGVPGSFQFLLEGAKPLSGRLANDGKDLRFYGNLTYNF